MAFFVALEVLLLGCILYAIYKHKVLSADLHIGVAFCLLQIPSAVYRGKGKYADGKTLS